MANIIDKTIIDKTSLPKLQKLLDLSSLRNKLISSNIANVTTPGYKRESIDFDEELKRAYVKEKLPIQTTNPGHIPLSNSRNRAPEVISDESNVNSTGINSVDIDNEMADLAQNQIVFELGSKLAGDKFKAIKAAIRGRA